MAAKKLDELVVDWGGFEKFIADLNRDGIVEVFHDVVLPGRSGASRQIDVLIKHRQGLYNHLIVAECKFRNSAIERLHVDALATTIKEVGASRGVIFSTKGFQSGAIVQAKHENIDLFKVRELTDEEWGLPGREVDITLQCAFISLGKLTPESVMLSFQPTGPLSINLELGTDVKTRISNRADGKFLEDLLVESSLNAANQIAKEGRVVQDNIFDLEIRYRSLFLCIFKDPIVIEVSPGKYMMIPRFKIELGIQILQNRMLFDRAENMAFALAVEDCVRSTVTAATRYSGDERTVLTDLRKSNQDDKDAAWQNGATIRAWIGEPIAFSVFADMSENTFSVRPHEPADQRYAYRPRS